MRRWFAVALTLASLLAAPVRAQEGTVAIPHPAKLVHVRATPVALTAGAGRTANVTLDITPGWHINANPPSPDYMVATTVELAGAGGVILATPVYPKGRAIKLGFEEGEISVLDGSVSIELPLVASAQAVDGMHTLAGKIKFQACNDQLCLAPASVPFSLAVTVTGGTQPGAVTTPPPGEVDAVLPDSAAADTLAAREGRATAFMCVNRSCQLPVTDPAAFSAELDAPTR